MAVTGPMLLLKIFVVAVMLSIGLRATRSDFLNALRDRSLLGRALLANCVIVPLLGYVITKLFPMNADMTLGVLLLAALPGTPVALQFTRKATTRLAFAASLTLILSILSVVITPLVLKLMPEAQPHFHRPLLVMLGELALYVVAPVGLGQWLSLTSPSTSRRLITPLNVIATICFVSIMFDVRDVKKEALHDLAGNPVYAMTTLIIVALIVGWYLGGPDRASRRVLAASTSMRSVIVCFFIAKAWFPATNLFLVPVAYLALMIAINKIFNFYQDRVDRREKDGMALPKAA